MQERNVGERLRQARLNKNITIDELQQITKIQKRYLEAIEINNFDALPGTFYVRAFIRQFAEAVGEDGDALVDIFDGKDVAAPKAKIPEPIEVSRKDVHKEEEGVKSLWSRLPMIVLGIVALGIVVVVAAMMMTDSKNNRVINTPESSVIVEKESSTSSSSSETETTESTTTTETSTTESSEAPKMAVTFDGENGSDVSMTANEVTTPVSLTFKGTGSCWVGVQVNGGFIYQYTLSAGDQQTAPIPDGTTAATIVLGASSNVEVSLNNEMLNFNPNGTAAVKRNINLTLNYHQ